MRSTRSRRAPPAADTGRNPRRFNRWRQQHGLPVRCPATLRNEAEQAAFAALAADAAVVAAYGLILPQPILTAPRLGCLNVHASLLPRWRGAAPIQRALLAGDPETGITIMQMEEGLDTGPILLQETVPIAPDATSAGLSAELAILGGRLMLMALDGVAEGRLVGTPQPQEGVTYAPKIGREEGPARLAAAFDRSGAAGPGIRPLAGVLFRDRRREDPGARRDRSAGSSRGHAGHGARRPLDRCLRRGRPAPLAAAAARPRRARRPGLPARISDPSRDEAAVPRYKLTIEYDGSGLVGWQRQANGLSVQEALETAIPKFCGETVTVHGAGRTDAGVHALAQTAHLDLARAAAPEVLRGAVNHHLRPNAISVLAAERVCDEFDARLSAVGRVYLYRILNRRAPPALERGRVWQVAPPLDVEAMRAGAHHLIGHHDFSTFRDSLCQARSPLKTLDALEVGRAGDEIHITAHARSFLHHQVRNMAGTLKLVGLGRWHPDDVARALAARDRRAGGPTAPPEGLYLVEIRYPSR